MLEVSGISAAYGKVHVLWDVTFEVGEAEIVAIIGPNGAGKTTLLKAISGLVTPRAGTVRLDGRDVTCRRPNEMVARGVAHVPEGRRVFAEMTVVENLEMGSYNGRARVVRRASLDAAFRLFPVLERKRTTAAGGLSGGEQQMLAIARGLMAKPRLLMLDEPSLGLAPLLVEELFAVLERINREEGVAILLVEQNTQYALERLATRGYVLENGRVVLSGSSSALLDDPKVREAYLGM
jgi:branched-chain amino acid transport system ATP-binding protein